MAVKNGFHDEALGDLYPFQDRYLELADGHSMHFIEMGRAGLRRPTFLLLHGNPTWSFLYRRFMEPLAKVGRVIAVDHIGYGRSDHPVDPAYYRLEKHILNLEEFCERLGLKRVVPVMQDWGGPIGLGYATRHPDRVAGLVLMNTWAFTRHTPPRLPWWFKTLRARGVGEFAWGRRNWFVEKVLPKLLVDDPDPHVMAAYRHPFPNADSRVAVVQAPRMIPTSEDHPDWHALDAIEKALPDLDVPVAIIWGTQDPAFPKRFAHAFHELLPQARAPVWVAGAGHFLQEDAPEDVISHILEFSRRL